jgi:import inner membrane translocase subunit TIM23
VGVFAPLLAEQDFDSWGAQISGLDPVIVLGISTFAIAAGGWLCGPSFGTAGFTLWAGRRGWTKFIAQVSWERKMWSSKQDMLTISQKEKSFYARIKKYRADASSSSPQNPIPDYYGEKIASVKDYRRWLKDQRAFNLKKNKNMI